MERVVFDFGAACNDEGECLVKRTTLEAAANVITSLNDTVDNLVLSRNQCIDSLTHSEFVSLKKDEEIHYMEQHASRNELIAGLKQAVTFIGCAGLLWVK